MDDLVAEFLVETNESLGELDLDLVKLEKEPNDKDLLSRIFRLIHTLKGTCGFLGLPRLEKLAHKGEDVLGLFRDGTLEVTGEYVTLIFNSLDRIKYMIAELEMNGAEPEGDDNDLIAQLEAVYEKGVSGGAASSDGDAAESEGAPDQVTDVPEVEASEPVEGVAAPPAVETPPLSPPPPANAAAEDAPAAAASSSVANQSLRVSVEVLENLMTMVSELVLTRNQLLQILRAQQDSEFTIPLQRLNHVVSDLQEGVMKTRMQPVGNAWSKFPRIIRDITTEMGKKIDLVMQGQDTELDRQVLELIKDPLMHMVRNSADHGIEMPNERVAAGKSETGTIKLNSYHEGGHIIIEIADDGKGLSVEKIKAKAIANELATAEELEAMPPQQIQMFIFKAGFSTAEKITAVSGRGVGMDVVRTNIEKIGGSIDLKSTEGVGSTFTIKIPLTLAIVSALIVETGGERFAIPQLAVQELVMISATAGSDGIEMIKGSPVFRLRDRLLPLVSLKDLLKLSSPEDHDAFKNELQIDPVAEVAQGDGAAPKEEFGSESQNVDGHRYIVVMQTGTYTFGIIVDRVFDTEEIVIKPVANILKDIEMFSGNTILGDGSVIMILDPAGIAKSSGEIDTADAAAEAVKDGAGSVHDDKTSLLLFGAGSGGPKAVPLELVSRIESIETKNVEEADGQMVIQYRGQLMPLMLLDSATDVRASDNKPALVFTDEQSGKSLGLVVDEIIDIIDEHIDVQVESGQSKYIGSAIINEKSTDVINVSHFLEESNVGWYTDGRVAEGVQKRVLLVEDSPFFRNMLVPLLKVAGYAVTETEKPADALELCDKGELFDIIVSDIEMPDMDGFEFAKKVKADPKWTNTPIVALSSRATPQDIDRGIEAGFVKHIAKFDRDTLLDAISQTLVEHGSLKQDNSEQGSAA